MGVKINKKIVYSDVCHLRNECGQGLSKSIVESFFEDKMPGYLGILEELVSEGKLKRVTHNNNNDYYCPNDGSYCIEEHHRDGSEETIHSMDFMKTFIGVDNENLPFVVPKVTRDEFVFGIANEEYEKWKESHKVELGVLMRNVLKHRNKSWWSKLCFWKNL